MLGVRGGVWPETLTHLRACGEFGVECVVYWTGPVTDSGLVDGVVHPEHVSSAAHYELAQSWLGEFVVQLHRERRTVRAQVHTHSGRAFHSETDDRWPMVRTPGFLSLVVPRFAGQFRLDELYLAKLDETGCWQRVRVKEHLEGIT